MAKADLTAQRLRELLDYDPETGVFRWIVRPARSHIQIGDAAGSVKLDGYIAIGIDHSHYKAHRLAWLFVHGAWPIGQIDHIDRNRSNNAICNLRECIGGIQNNHNRTIPRSNTSGFHGVSYNAQRQKWRAGIKVNYRSITIGYFHSAEAAAAAYEKYKSIYHNQPA